jgi:hypothetical protein
LKILILGGYGTFGGRLAHLLADDTRLDLLLAGRSEAKAAALIGTLPAGARKTAVALDREGDFKAQLVELLPDVVVDATGPFQAYGDNPYRVVEACLALGVSYLDLADGSDFVAGIVRFDGEARARGVFVLSGVSSFPVLTAAVVRRLSAGIDEIDTITGGIAPSPYAGVGLNVIRAIASYAGKPVAIRRNGATATGYPFTETMRATVAPPGHLPLKSTLFALVDVPDNRVLPDLRPSLGSVWIGVGPKPEVLFRGLIGLAWLVRLRLLPSLAPLARQFQRASNTLRFGENRGGMFVTIRGRRGGEAVERSWHMIAEGNDGPLIPSMAAAAVILRCLAGCPPPAGARAAAEDLELDDYDTLFHGRGIVAGVRDTPARRGDGPLYRRLLGEAWAVLPPSLRAMHDVTGAKRAEGRANVERGGGLLSRLAGAMVGFPKAGRDVPVALQFEASKGEERWRRTFAGTSFASLQSEGSGRSEHLLVERFGPLSFGIALVVEGDRLRLMVRRWSVLGIPLPLWLAPGGEAFEHEEEGRFRFHVEIAHPLTGLIVRYRGWLVPT